MGRGPVSECFWSAGVIRRCATLPAWQQPYPTHGHQGRVANIVSDAPDVHSTVLQSRASPQYSILLVSCALQCRTCVPSTQEMDHFSTQNMYAQLLFWQSDKNVMPSDHDMASA